MDDKSEVNMDTDVSSTTADVPEIQRNNMGSTGQVETVIVVEELDEGTEKEMSSALAKEESQSASDNEVESCSRSPPNDEVSTNDAGESVDEKILLEPVNSNHISPILENVEQTSGELAQCNIQEQVTTTKSSPMKSTESNIKTSLIKTIECNTKPSPIKNVECKKTLDSPNIVPVDSVSKEDGKPDIPEIAIEKKSPIKKLEMEEIQTTCIEISKTCNDPTSKKQEVSVDICEQSNDSQVDSVSDVSEKDHNKSISRELKSLMKSAKESKIISECTQLTTKTRKSRAGLDTSSSASPNIDSEKVQGRRNSTNSQVSISSDISEKTQLKRSMRSQNPEFVHKVKQFLNSVTRKHQRSESDDEDSDEIKRKTDSPTPKKKKQNDQVEEKQVMDGKARSDLYCWRCHWQVEMAPNEKGHSPMYCTVCPRSFHYKCQSLAERNKIDPDKSWVCPECMSILQAETSETRSPAMKRISVGELRELLQHALQRMTELNGVEPFMSPVDRTEFPDYDKYVINPMDLAVIKDNVAEGHYGSTEAFAADVQWILHNSIIFNTLQSKLTAGARALVRTCRAEMGEIEACPQCYAGAHARKHTWFVDVCSTPHILLWAKLKGFPYWPAKGMSVNNTGMVDVRFFGAHDRAWVPAKDCFLYSEKDPNGFKAKRQDIIDSMQEAENHIRNISRKYGKFVYPPFKTPFEPHMLIEQLKAMIPSFDGEIKTNYKEKANTSITVTPKNKRRSESKSSKSSTHDGDMSESEDSQLTKSRKMADGAIIAKEEEDSAAENDTTMELDTSKTKKEDTRKRRRSVLEEAVITILENSSSSKKKRVDNESQKESHNGCVNTSMTKSKNESTDKKEAKAKKPEAPSSKEVSESQSSTDKVDKAENKTPIKTVIKVKNNKTSTPKEKIDKPTPKQKIEIEKVSTPDSAKVLRIRIDKSKQSTPSSGQAGERSIERRGSEKKDKDAPQTPKDQTKEKSASKNKEAQQNKNNEKVKDDSKPTKKLRRELTISAVSSSPRNNGLPTISSVRSLSTVAQPSSTTTPATSSKTIEITIDPKPSSSIFTPTSTDSVKNMKEATTKLDVLRNGKQPGFGKVGVRAFARMTSPEKPKDVEVEIKTEPIDFGDADRQTEKLDLMNVFRLRPVNPAQKLREVRINKVLAPTAPVVNKPVVKPSDPKPKARKSFPQPRKPDEGRSELNGKNSMVYIPIQPPTTQAPVRQVRPVAVNTSVPVLRPPVPNATSSATIANSVAPPTVPLVTSSTTNPTPSTVVVSKNNMALGQMPTVHTVPYITSVNGQCYFSLQPIMSVGGVDNPPGAVVGEVPVPSVAPPMPILQAPAAPAAPVLNGTVETDKLPEPQTTELPRLQQRPGYVNPLDANAPSAPPTSSLAGPITCKLNQHANKMMNFFRTLLEDSIEKWDDPMAQLTAAKLQLETLKWKSQQEAKEIKHNFDLTVSEMRGAFEKEKARAVAEAWRSAHVEMEAALKAAKCKQWCANCSQEAQFYCCWNTSYCDYPCQRAHWTQHYAVCTQERKQDNNNSSNSTTLDKRLQSAPDNVPALQKSSAAPTLTVGGKVAQVRVQGKDQSAQSAQPAQQAAKSSIIVSPVFPVSMVDDKSGVQTVKCVGTYKTGAPQMPPLILNNQMNNEEGGQKKVMTSGGYLIVGSGSNAPLVTPRRTQTIQYFQ